MREYFTPINIYAKLPIKCAFPWEVELVIFTPKPFLVVLGVTSVIIFVKYGGVGEVVEGKL